MLSTIIAAASPEPAEKTLNLGEAAVEKGLPFAEQVVADASGTGWSILGTFITSFLSLSLTVGAVVVLGFLIYGALEWIWSEGDSGKLEKARNRMINAVIGLLLLSASLAIFNVLQAFLGVELIRFQKGGGVGGGDDNGGGDTTGMCPCNNGKWARSGWTGIGNDGGCYDCVNGSWVPSESSSCSPIQCIDP